MGAILIDPFAAVIGGDDVEPEGLHHAAGDGADRLFVVDYQDGAAAPPHVGQRLVRQHLRGARYGGEEQLEGRALARLAVDLHRALVAANDAEYGAEAESAPGEFRGEKRIED